jgi:hypothetical protein
MKTKNYILFGIFVVFVMAFLVYGITVGERQSAELAMKHRVEEALERAAKQTGYESLGVVDIYEISRRNGNLYDGPAIRQELFKQNGLDVPANAWSFWFGETDDGVLLYKLVTYKGEKTGSIFDMEVDKVYLYGEI